MERSSRLLIILVLIFAFSFPQVHASTNAQILSSTGYMDTINHYHVVGEVLNSGTQALNLVQITSTFYNQSNVVVGTSFAFTSLSIVPPDRKSPFDIVLLNTDQSAKVHHYSLSIQFSDATTLPQMLIFMTNSSYTDAINYHHIVGEIKNTGTQSATYVEAIATYYNSTGGVIATSWAYTNPYTMTTNSTAPFDITLEPSRAALIDYYALTAGSDQYAVVPEFSNLISLAATLIPFTVIIAFTYRRTRK